MSEIFDPYHEWLGIPAAEQPASYYRLLGIPALETSPSVIDNAANQRMAHLRTFQSGKHAAESQRLLNEVAAARVCLLNAAKKATYDEELRKRLAPKKSLVVAQPAESGLDEIFAMPIATGASATGGRIGASAIAKGRREAAALQHAAAHRCGCNYGRDRLGRYRTDSLRGSRPGEQAAADDSTNTAGSASALRKSANAAAPISKPKPSTKASSESNSSIAKEATSAAAPKPMEIARADAKPESPAVGASGNPSSTTGGTSTAASPNLGRTWIRRREPSPPPTHPPQGQRRRARKNRRPRFRRHRPTSRKSLSPKSTRFTNRAVPATRPRRRPWPASYWTTARKTAGKLPSSSSCFAARASWLATRARWT